MEEEEHVDRATEEEIERELEMLSWRRSGGAKDLIASSAGGTEVDRQKHQREVGWHDGEEDPC